jgi:perosamine synthetase
MFRLIAPAGAPIPIRAIMCAVVSAVRRDNYLERFESAIKSHADVKHCYFLNSGRTALYFILKALQKQAADCQNEVVVPAYTCFSVPAAIIKSGLKIRPVDIKPMTMDYDYEKLSRINFKNVLAILGNNLFGILSDWNKLRSLAKANGVFLIDDAAQSLGSTYEGKASGSLGDAGFYSLGRGKNLSTYAGGILLINDDKIADDLKKEITDMCKNGYDNGLSLLTSIFPYSQLLKPSLYWLPNKMPFLGLGKTVMDADFRLEKLTRLQINLGSILFPGLDDLNRTRAANSDKLAELIMKLKNYKIPGYNSPDRPIYIRLPLLTSAAAMRDHIIDALRKQGIAASPMYPSTIRRIAGIDKYLAAPDDDFPGAQFVVDRLLTLPTHPYLTDRDILKIGSCLTGG